MTLLLIPDIYKAPHMPQTNMKLTVLAVQAMVEQMQRDHALLRARIQRLGGQAGLARLEAALAAVKSNAPMTPPTPPRMSPRGTPPRTPPAAQHPVSSPATVARQQDPNEALAWELLYDATWRMPTTELDALWDDATGATGADFTRPT